ncbi:peptidyl-prolyl cis-trans isomerase [Phenylobacterium sp.]|uniref:peptidylprolyl isomerase n=1 Tax=Phenylobacterium sp. TaxID=1871053 RepID=UPI0039839806
MRARAWSLLKQPLVQFVLIGVLIYGGWKLKNPHAEAVPTEIRVGAAELRWLHDTWIGQFGHAPDATEMRSAIRGYIDEEVRYREGLALGLDRDDTIVRRRLAQKYDFMLGAQAADMIATDRQLTDQLARHPERYREPTQTAFCQVYLGDQAAGLVAAQSALAKLSPGELADPNARIQTRQELPFERCYKASKPADLARDFGPNFATVVDGRLPVGRWQGPVESGYGYHLVLVTARTPGAPATLASARPRIDADWRAEAMTGARKRQDEDLRRRYSVTVDDAAMKRLLQGTAK